ncbi:M56 family metallopeptidase [Brevibacterium sp. R8603A2]|uniref:M56 family metallopeptidase n=1 Tax=Brevibacterium sp. R8603A2 TaxID=2929779 RepID=UPI001FF8BFCA|nr:M56 family metallopeptidase [Brevibacterium sp. R8603A2]MCK1803653.1 M56 family metallopeptidase [Brevibacterium sp. R8603A2]
MLITGTLLAVLALVLAWPVPVALARRSPLIDPLSRLVLWQAVGLAGGLSLIGTAVVFATAPMAGSLGDGLIGLADLQALSVLAWWQWLLLLVAVLLTVRLIGSLLVQSVLVLRHRRRHSALVDLLTEPSAELPNTRVLTSDSPVAYCLPGRGSGTTVVTTGLLAVLTDEQRRAVVAHEQAHLDLHHDLLVLPFAAWNRALPFVPATSTALAAVSALIEFMADDRARASLGAESLAEAVETGARVHPGAHSTDLTRARLARLDRELPAARTRVRTVKLVAAACLVLVPTLILAAPTLA